MSDKRWDREVTAVVDVLSEMATRQGTTWEPDPDRPGYERFLLPDIVLPGNVVFKNNWIARKLEEQDV